MQARVYLIINLINAKRYVGSTKKTLEQRWWGHCYDAFKLQSPMRLHMALRKYGRENFRIELLRECASREDAFEVEREFIIELGTHVTLGQGYNVTWGKGGGTRGMLGKRHSKETRKQMSETAKGRHHTETTKMKMSKQRCGTTRGSYKTSKLIEQIDDVGNVIATFRTLTEACVQFTGTGRTHIWECCVGKRKRARGFTWRHFVHPEVSG